MAGTRQDKAREEEKFQRITSQWFTPVTFGFLVLVTVFSWLLWGVVRGATGVLLSFAPLQLLDAGGMWGESVWSGRWDRLFTAGLLHGSPLELSIIAMLVGIVGFAVERYLGPARTVIILLSGCIAGSVVGLFVGSHEVLVGSWSGGFALFGAALFLFVFRNSDLVPHHRGLGRQTNVVLLAASMSAVNMLHFLPWTSILLFLISGILSGVVTAYLLTRSGPLISEGPSYRWTVVALGLVALFVAALVTSAVHLRSQENLQEERLQWVKSGVERANDEAEERSLFRMTVDGSNHLLDTKHRDELLLEVIATTDLFVFDVAALPIGSDNRRCPSDSSEADAWHQSVIDVLGAEKEEEYRSAVSVVCR